MFISAARSFRQQAGPVADMPVTAAHERQDGIPTAALLIHAPSRNKASNAIRGKDRLILGISVFDASFQNSLNMVNPEVRYRVKVQNWTLRAHHRNHDADEQSPHKNIQEAGRLADLKIAFDRSIRTSLRIAT
ncbi:MAG: hypothetical protein EC577_08190 [Acidithiobacillus ferrooxidans]|uniref:Uncharacterized protein n=1 Tax=Acidithiobacillus ferrooxidans TaxID=920 RepID=A0A2W1K0T5_ACIFR|nr:MULTISPECIES: hypothetical protein [Acidithiobacillus]EGQ63429.1 hypothetical protein GGI1_19349 [Acidithiobacillus sp. GGI-221]MBN6747699.1 hypothetical protein [Acidithiobacillus sp. PG05]MBU2772801.1 hypothetical protein [Acidithiobacillus ferrooxidans]MBU2819207.1 hypothetical protein [Acidithiobacillus ferrooxidans]MBU2822746.1 hypothetical protein [Acidithiobacillus ferrooxidans]